MTETLESIAQYFLALQGALDDSTFNALLSAFFKSL